MSKKKKNRISEPEAIEVLKSYGFFVKKMNYYQFRLYKEEDTQESRFFDWYHTTGATVMADTGFLKSLGTFKDAEDLSLFINKTYFN